jgi:enterochelin esterase-like enzyme
MDNVKWPNARVPLLTHLSIFILMAFLATPLALSQDGRLTRETVHSSALERTVTGESPDRSVTIYLPPSYNTSANKRYPVIYLLHGIGGTDEDWTSGKQPWMNIRDLMDKGIAENKFGEMIIVMPDERTKWFGSFYTNSSVTGNWEDFTVRELVSYVDRKYRTLAKAESRGVAGHSMGGYGAITLGMKHPEIYRVVYGINPALLGWAGDLTIANPAFASDLTATSYDDLLKGDAFTMGIVTVAQAFSPNPSRPPFFVDFPFVMVSGRLQPAEPAFSKWEENFPANMVKRYRANLLKLRGLRFDSGSEDEYKFIPPNSRALSVALTNNGIDHVFEEYNGDHRNRMWGETGRLYTEVLPYFWSLLESQNSRD